MIEITAKSKITGRIIKSSYTARQLLENFIDEVDLLQDMTKCNCQPLGESNQYDCNCEAEWDEYVLIVGSEETIDNDFLDR